ncbi:MAG: hypothetical protein JRI23_19485 [Deltaproteobacteria bacterium]|nr:hypothetical protein [Deltaproteobacteria bacterium]MBW2534048.1 hypothetical protein [Deltaproteobacteria bacterium]
MKSIPGSQCGGLVRRHGGSAQLGVFGHRFPWGPLLGMLLATVPAACDEPEVTERLAAVGIRCSTESCPVHDRCCHTCSHAGAWQIVGKPEVSIETTDAAGPLPTCEVDGCGDCGYEIATKGWVKRRTFTVVDWSLIAPATPPAERWDRDEHLLEIDRRVRKAGSPAMECAPSTVCATRAARTQCRQAVIACATTAAWKHYPSCKEGCEGQRYGACSPGCSQHCTPSECSDRGGQPVCTDDCRGPRSCICPKTAEFLRLFGVNYPPVAPPPFPADAGAPDAGANVRNGGPAW